MREHVGIVMFDSCFTRQYVCTYLLLAMASLVVYGQEKSTIQWVSWEEVTELNAEAPRKIVVDIYTDWCGWCKKMDKSTFQNASVAEYINDNYYAVKFNAEYKSDIELNDKVYKFVKQGQRGYHQLAAELTFGKLSFPTIVFLDEDLEVIQPIPGYKDHEVFKMIMTYFGEDFHKTTPWKRYAAMYEDDKG